MSKELKIAIESIRIAIIALAITIIISIVPLSLSLIAPGLKEIAIKITILMYSVFVVWLIYLASKIKLKRRRLNKKRLFK